MLKKSPAVYLLAVMCAMIATPAQSAVQRAFVASYGLNSNTSFDCDVTHPCRQFLAAVTVVNPDGEVVALDTAAYGAVTLTQSISLTAAPGAYAGITVFPGSNGVTIATPGVNVVLRGLTINSQGGDAGILMTAGAKLSIENCVIANFSIIGSPFNQYGVLVQTAATVRMVNTLIRDNDIGIQIQDGATADISGSKFFGNSTYGIVAFNDINGTTTTAAVSDTVVTGGGIGIYAIVDSASTATARAEIVRSIVSNYSGGVAAESQNGTASVSIRKSMVTGSSIYGLGQIGSGATMTSYGNNMLSNNSSNLLGTLTTVAPL
ncbi:right-handed parallel beta-helix repeat-containing protein [Candidatus Nitrotoga sp. AM1P]|uniref:right-handed parallel beta-helix repeat-containing protein n=1 Tax=Candidatus Nitrotoga sp. AM1P TaxID=2559597 RepID=UPI0010AFB41B|nr:right-handed parallel beta-helix repeat-containing protein [Candidatus Nitrotoga sp. AM1P]BBJ22924.1 hypothetical protein W01_08510 [Candidatus Nitrotoga sp. AM1P]